MKKQMSAKLLLTDLSYQELESWVVALGEPSFRAQQLFEWIYRHRADGFDRMTNLSVSLRKTLGERLRFQSLKVRDAVTSANELTEKVLLELADGETIESVLMHYEGRHTVCLSTQVGCPIGCPFCATGLGGFARNLTSGEIVDQVLYFARKLRARSFSVTHVVFMGMGEPLRNYDATWRAIRVLNDPRGFGLGARRFTVSTAGLVPEIQRLAGEDLPVGLAVSLHAADDALRDRLVPVNQRYPLGQLLEACGEYARRTRRRVTYEYAMIDGVNDSAEHARQLAELLRGQLCHVNLIPLNPTGQGGYQPSGRVRVLAFRAELNRVGVANTVRLARGTDIDAGCGQLRSRQHAIDSTKP
jgi:23S rRNA (adenine2503-C2)-methyltransferase